MINVKPIRQEAGVLSPLKKILDIDAMIGRNAKKRIGQYQIIWERDIVLIDGKEIPLKVINKIAQKIEDTSEWIANKRAGQVEDEIDDILYKQATI